MIAVLPEIFRSGNSSFGRSRVKEVRRGARTLDLDILLCEDLVIQTPDLVVPHPLMTERLFVLVPLLELAPDLQDPRTGEPYSRFRASLEDDLAAIGEYAPDVAIGTTPVVQAAKSRAIPALYFTNLISARPLMGAAGAGSLSKVINAALANRERFAGMKSFFEGVGEGYAAGVWSEKPVDRRKAKVSGRKEIDAC